jgi:hypothetical protein
VEALFPSMYKDNSLVFKLQVTTIICLLLESNLEMSCSRSTLPLFNATRNTFSLLSSSFKIKIFPPSGFMDNSGVVFPSLNCSLFSGVQKLIVPSSIFKLFDIFMLFLFLLRCAGNIEALSDYSIAIDCKMVVCALIIYTFIDCSYTN